MRTSIPRPFADEDIDSDRGSTAKHSQFHRLADRLRAEAVRHAGDSFDGFTTPCSDDVPDKEPRPVRGAVRLHADNDGAPAFTHGMQGNTKVATRDVALL